MSAWIVITGDHLKDYLVSAQVTAIRTAALGTGQADRFTNVMHDRANYIRNRISKRLQISATPYAVPPELKTCACMLIIESMQTTIPSLALTEDQVRLITRAYKDLDIAGTEDMPISHPDDAVAPSVQTPGGATVVTKPSSTLTRESMAGL